MRYLVGFQLSNANGLVTGEASDPLEMTSYQVIALGSDLEWLFEQKLRDDFTLVPIFDDTIEDYELLLFIEDETLQRIT